jgi:type IV pilus assembly protein PilC
MRNVAMARFCRTLSTLYASGVPLGDGLEMVARGLGVPRLEKQVLEVREGVMNGEALALALRRRPDFPALLVGMVSAGQESGSLDRMLDRLAEIYESKVDAGLRAAVAALEPLVIILVGLMVGGTLVVLGLPFLNLGSLF